VSAPGRIFPLLIAAAFLAAAAAPCTPSTADPGLLRADARDSDAPRLTTPCPCHCEKQSGTLGVARIGVALAKSVDHAFPWRGDFPSHLAEARLPPAPSFELDPVPI